MKSTDQRILAQAQRSPGSVASRHGQDIMTFLTLEEVSNRIAGFLLQRGVRPGDRVGLCVERGIHLPAAILGVLKAGAAYVPLDPSFPPARLEFMVRDSAPRLVVASSQHRHLLGNQVEVRTVEEVLDHSEAFNPATEGSLIRPELPAYVIYTSGSTGTPKGVALPHRALDNLLEWQVGQPGFTEPGVTLQFTPAGFDVHFQEMFATLATGGTLVHVDNPIRLDPFRLLPLMEREGVQRLFLPFVALQQLAEVGTAFDLVPTTLVDVVTAGEQLRVTDALREFFSRIVGCRLHNHYGPSETHVVTAHTLSPDPREWPSLPSIGKPLSNISAHILDPELNPVEAGQEGELCFSGPCVALGYWGREELSAQRFVPAPTGNVLMYRTGDLGRKDGKGEIEFFGRADDQIKLRGHRVELGEVEAAIMRHPAVAECAVLPSSEGSGGEPLTAYLVLDSNRPGASGATRGLDQERLHQWQSVWDSTYAGTTDDADSENQEMAGWRSSYDGKGLPGQDMEAWADEAVARILAREPRRVLEIGCGGGLILSRLAHHLEAFTGIDFSSTAIDALKAQYADAPPCPEFSLQVGAAHDLGALKGMGFDTIVLNSVTQHFPSPSYLFQVVESLLDLVPNGQLFLGDISSHALTEAFLTSVEDFRAEGEEAMDRFRGKIDLRLGEAHEFRIHPDLFHKLAERYPSIAWVETQLKPGRYRNELADYRYDVWLGTGEARREARREAQDVDWRDWKESALDLSQIKEILDGGIPQALGLAGIPNDRVMDAVRGATLMRGQSYTTVAEWRGDRDRHRPPGHDPQDFWDLQKDYDCHVTVDWSPDPASFDVLIRPAAQGSVPCNRSGTRSAAPWPALTTSPLNTSLFPEVVNALESSLGSALPEYMIPGQFLLLTGLPRTASGKLDRRKLPLPLRRRRHRGGEATPPKGETEMALATIWEDILGVEGMGAEDSFFDLGGNSILSVRLVMAVRQQMSRELPLVMLFEYPTVRSLAAHFDQEAACPEEGEPSSADRAAKQRRAFSKARDTRRRK